MAEKRKTENCAVCGSALQYLTTSERLVCSYCGKTVEGHVKCPDNHFICGTCHGGESLKMMEEFLTATSEQDAAGMAELLMSHPSLPMLGCEHAFIAGGALAAALRNSPYTRFTDVEVREVLMRTQRQAISGYCGLTGVCGIVPALGACFSVFLGARCGSDSEQKIVMDAVIKISGSIAGLTGPSCCKAYVRAAIATAVAIFGERFGIVLPSANLAVACKHPDRHPHGCREVKCPYYHESKDVFADSVRLPVTACQS